MSTAAVITRLEWIKDYQRQMRRDVDEGAES